MKYKNADDVFSDKHDSLDITACGIVSAPNQIIYPKSLKCPWNFVLVKINGFSLLSTYVMQGPSKSLWNVV